MSIRFRYIIPTAFELVSLIFLTLAVVIVGTSRQLVQYYGLDSSTAVLKSNAGSAISSGLVKIDNFGLTYKAVTFGVWALVGLFCYSIGHALVLFYQEVELTKQVGSNHYVHPSTFVRAAFWGRVAEAFVTVVIAVGLVAAGLYVFLAYSLPACLAYTREFLQGVSFAHVGPFLLGCAIMYASLVMLVICLKLLVNHQRLFRS